MALIAYQDPQHASYHGPKTVNCYGCGVACSKSAWGKWCHPCNVKRLDGISAALDGMSERLRFSEAVAKATEDRERLVEHLIIQRDAILRAAGGRVTATKEQHRQSSYWSHQSHKDGSETYAVDL
jgi:hypothetical protein